MSSQEGTPGRRAARLRSVLDANEEHEPIRRARDELEDGNAIERFEDPIEGSDRRDDDTSSKNERLELELREANDRIRELQQDVEMLCMQQVDSLSSTVISQRLLELHNELTDTRKLLSQARLDKEVLQGELHALEYKKENLLTNWRQEKEKNTKLNSDVQFFQSQAASAMEERDRTIVQLEGTSSKVSRLQKDLEISERLKSNLEQDSSRLQASIVALETSLEDAMKELKEERSKRQTFEDMCQKFDAEIASIEEEREKEAADVAAKIDDACSTIRRALLDKEQQISIMQGQLQAVADAKVKALVEMSEKEELLRIEMERRMETEIALHKAQGQLSQALEERSSLILENAENKKRMQISRDQKRAEDSSPSVSGEEMLSASVLTKSWSALFYGGKGEDLEEED